MVSNSVAAMISVPPNPTAQSGEFSMPTVHGSVQRISCSDGGCHGHDRGHEVTNEVEYPVHL